MNKVQRMPWLSVTSALKYSLIETKYSLIETMMDISLLENVAVKFVRLIICQQGNKFKN